MSYTKEQIQAVSAKLKALPALNSFTSKEAVEQLQADIMELREKGYSIEMIQEILNKEGIKIALSTLRLYLRRPRKKKKNTPAENIKKTIPQSSSSNFVKPDTEDI